MAQWQPNRAARRSSRGWKDEYADLVTSERHNTFGMAYAWGRLAARLGWNLHEDLHNEVDPAFHQVACTAYQSVKRTSLMLGRPCHGETTRLIWPSLQPHECRGRANWEVLPMATTLMIFLSDLLINAVFEAVVAKWLVELDVCCK